MKKLAVMALAVSLAAVPASAAGVTISGYIDVGYWASENPQAFQPGSLGGGVAGRLHASTGTNGGWDGDNQFALNDVNIDINTKFTEDITSYISWNYVNGAAGAIDYAQVDFTNLIPWGHKLTVGRFGSPIGIEQRISESNLNKFINMSLLSPITVGSQDGIAVSGSMNPVSYIVAITNNDNLGGATIGTAPRNPTIAGAVGAVADNNNNKSISGRLGVTPVEGLELGVSASHSVWAGPAAGGAVVPDDKNPARNIVVGDLSYIWGAFTFKGEYVYVKEQQTLKVAGGERPIKWNGYYIEGWYDWTSKFGLGVRYNRMETKQSRNTVPGFAVTDQASDYSTVAVAGAYKIADNLIFKAEYDLNEESTLNYQSTSGNEIDNDVITFSLVGSF